MVAIDQRCDELKASQKMGWREMPGHPSEAPAQTAVLVWELFRELARDSETKKRGDNFEAKLAEGEKAADALRVVLNDPMQTGVARDAAFQEMTQTCVACHKAHRNSTSVIPHPLLGP
jgi:hypothetical protein